MAVGTGIGNDVLDGLIWKQMIRAGALALERKKQEVDALNVFPVPDGDTGTNMHLTIQSASRDVDKVSGANVSEIMNAASMGSLMGARGNSGVILSQLLRGFAKGLEGLTTSNGMQIALALQAGVDTAYKAVIKPVEGTILTVAKETARGAMLEAKQSNDPLRVLQEGYRKGQEALSKTPQLLPALKQAGVVDAGGQGFLIIIGGWISVLDGSFKEELINPSVGSAIVNLNKEKTIKIDNLEYPYCTEFLVKGQNLNTEQIKNDLNGNGDCLLVVGTTEVVKIHIHSKNPGKILDYALQWGSLNEVQIHNMLAQNEAMAHAGKEEEQEIINKEFKENGLVAVVTGEGIAKVFQSLGADEVVFGGQTMNPSTEDLAQAVRKIPARHVYILPNNKNIIMAAQQVQAVIQEQEVHVISSRSIPQGITALINYNPEGDADYNLGNMQTSLDNVVSGEVTYAVRDSVYGEISIQSGDLLGIVEDSIITTGKDLLTVAQTSLEEMEWRKHDLITIFYGQDVEDVEVERLESWLLDENPDIEVEVHPGGQPLYYYIFGVE